MVAARDAFAEAWDVLKMGGNQHTAMMHDLPAYMEEALNQKKKTRNDGAVSERPTSPSASFRTRAHDAEPSLV